ncbi:DUF6287 domain-containing protein [Lacticaseibacillus thailandensis]|uniref:DUF6287 domain-containing protein n=1 Tax=Lacticaseibacillus thailandensis TaxID=381741 RepID=UPI0006D049C9|nr:DUF6287 domain-containing protein [Lacticaseibacillus thailandensis]
MARSSKSSAATASSSAASSAAQTSSQASNSSQAAGASLNVAAVAQENFSSLVGTWTNPQTGATLVVTNQTLVQPGNEYQGVTKGAVVSGHDVD